MKVYSWKIFIITMIAGIGGIGFSGRRLLQGDIWGIAWIIIFAILIFQGLSISLTQRGFQKEVLHSQISKEIYGELFGKFGSVMPYGALILFCLGAACVYFFSGQIWLGLALIIAAPVYQLWLIWIFKKQWEKKNQ